MEIELVEIRDFVAQYHPFDVLPMEVLNTLPSILKARYLRRGQSFPPQHLEGESLYIIRTGAIELRDHDHELLGQLAEGDVYTTECELVELQKDIHHRALEDTLYYLLPCQSVKSLCKQSPAFNQYFTDSMRDRLKQAAMYNNQSIDNNIASMATEVDELIIKQPVITDVDTAIQEAAIMMSENNVSAILLTENNKLVGLVTDRDLRKRCLAKGLDAKQPIKLIMSSNPETIQGHSQILSAMIEMTKHHIHHLPVMQGNQVIGMVTASDITRHSGSNPALITSEIRKAKTLDDLVHASRRLPELQLLLSNANITARHIGETISRITDAITIKLIELAQQELGPEPAPFVWLAGGSQARYEQTSHSDQDNAIILSDDTNEDQLAYFHKLARQVSDGLSACGFIYCPGDAMASNPRWCQPLSIWKGYFEEWIKRPEPKALMLSSIFFDLRPVYGDRSLHETLQQGMLEMTRKNSLFISHMAANALTHRPPLGFFRTFVLIHGGEHDDTFDLKHRGIVPITDIARLLALAEGISAVNTTKRLQAVARTHSMSREMAENLEDALEFIASLRIRHQSGQIRRSQVTDNFLSPDKLSDLERKHLKDAFSVIKDMQDTLENRYQTSRIG